MRTLPTGAGEEHDELRRRLRRLDRQGVVDSVTVRTWPHEVVVGEPATARDREITARVREFQQWAAGEGVELVGFDEGETAGVGRMGPTYDVLTVPQTALVVSRDGVVEWVAPCERDGAVQTPRAWVTAAAEGAAPGCESGPRLVA